jgi:transitional endoplasmic reticulum ATPase
MGTKPINMYDHLSDSCEYRNVLDCRFFFRIVEVTLLTMAQLTDYLGTLRVSDGLEVPQGIAVLNTQDAAAFGIDGSQPVLIRCSRRTVTDVKLEDAAPRGTIALCGVTRRNARAEVGMEVGLFKSDSQCATKVVFTPILRAADRDRNLVHDYLAPALTGDYAYHALHVGDKFEVQSAAGSLSFLVAQMTLNNEDIKYGVVTDDTVIACADSVSLEAHLKEEKSAGLRYSDIGGCKRALDSIKELVELPLKNPAVFQSIGITPPQGILLFGPPGTGKTRIARAVANESGAFFITINGPEVIAAERGASEKKLRAAFELASRNAPSIIFIDEIDSIAPNREQSSSSDERRMVTMLLTLMDGMVSRSQVVVIAATNRPNSLDPALRRCGRFDREVDVGVPDEVGRLELLNIHLNGVSILSDEVKLNLDKIAKDTHGYVGADIAQLCVEAVMSRLRESKDQISQFDPNAATAALANAKVSLKDFTDVMKKMTPSALRETKMERPSVDWNEIIGLEEVKLLLNESITYPIEYPDEYKRFGVTPAKGILLYGKPGCGKTLLARAVASQSKANFISIKGPELLTKWYGESEENIRRLFDRARSSAPCIIFFDEIDSIAKARGSGDSAASDRVINQLLTEMDGLAPNKDVFIIGATNVPELLDPAIMRPGRLDKLIEIPLPDKATILDMLTKKLKPDVRGDDVILDVIADKLDGFSGAEIISVCQRAASNAIRLQIAENQAAKREARTALVTKITQPHLEQALAEVLREAAKRGH